MFTNHFWRDIFCGDGDTGTIPHLRWHEHCPRQIHPYMQSLHTAPPYSKHHCTIVNAFPSSGKHPFPTRHQFTLRPLKQLKPYSLAAHIYSKKAPNILSSDWSIQISNIFPFSFSFLDRRHPFSSILPNYKVFDWEGGGLHCNRIVFVSVGGGLH